ncbi:MAG: flagellar type III secretion system pore protein FliP [Gemmataceae bacterium]|nr:flagellar type III secretion system pore protein FliP [Gemmataceae bacterium]
MFSNLPAPLQTALFLGSLAFIPAALVCLTSFTRIIIVLSFVRRAVTSQDIPPNLVLTGLALYLTLFTMGPLLEQVNARALTPYLDKKITAGKAAQAGIESLHAFMRKHTRKRDLALFLHLSNSPSPNAPEDTPFHILAPAYLISELKTAFIMGFCLFLPFLVIDLVVASVLTSMGMVLMPPAQIAAPLKVLLFVMADGWHLVAYALGISFR